MLVPAIRISSPKIEGLLQASKWLKVQVLLDPEELKDLLDALGEVHFLTVSDPVGAEDVEISKEAFLQKYTEYADLLKRGQVPRNEDFRRYFSCALSKTLDAFYAIPAGPEKYLIKPLKPVIQLQAHHFFYSDLDKKFHPMVLSGDSVSWGLQFSYPQLFQNPKTRQIEKVTDSLEFPTSSLFSTLSKWMRNATLPTPFEVDGVRVNAPIRMGKKTLPWINNHPQLKQRGIRIYRLGNA